MVSIWVRAGFTAYLLTTHLQIGIWQAVENATELPTTGSHGTGIEQKLFPDYLPSILHDRLVGAGIECPSVCHCIPVCELPVATRFWKDHWLKAQVSRLE
jgi:hypothetical protein